MKCIRYMNIIKVLVTVVIAFIYSNIVIADSACPSAFSMKDKIVGIFSKTENVLFYKDQDGYIKFAHIYFNGDLDKAFVAVSSSVSKFTFRQLGWRRFHGSIMNFKNLRRKFLKLRRFIGMENLIWAADKYTKGRMDIMFDNAFAVLDRQKFEQLQWRRFVGDTNKFYRLQRQLTNGNGAGNSIYKKQLGYAKFAMHYYEGDMGLAFRDAAVVLTRKQLQILGWQEFKGSVQEFYTIRSWLIDENGKLFEKCKQIIGYKHIAKEHFSGNMKKAFYTVKSVLDQEQFRELNWYPIEGYIDQYNRLIRNTEQQQHSASYM